MNRRHYPPIWDDQQTGEPSTSQTIYAIVLAAALVIITVIALIGGVP